jgi:WD40 repeat protein
MELRRAVAALPRTIARWDQDEDGKFVRFGPDGDIIESSGNRVRLLFPATLEERWSTPLAAVCEDATFDRANRYVVLRCRGGLQILDSRTGKVLHSIPAEDSTAALFSPDGKWLARVDREGVDAYSVPSWSPLWHSDIHLEVDKMAFATDGLVATISRSLNASDAIRVLSAADGKPVREWPADDNSIAWARIVAVSPVGDFVLFASGDKSLSLLDVRTGEVVGRLPGQDKVVAFNPYRFYTGGHAFFSPDGRLLAISSATADLTVYRTPDLSQVMPPQHFTVNARFGVLIAAFSRDNRYLAVTDDARIAVLAVPTADEVFSAARLDSISLAQFGPDARYLSVYLRGGAALYSLSREDEVRTMALADNQRPLFLSPAGRYVAIRNNSEKQDLFAEVVDDIYDLSTGKKLAYPQPSAVLAFSPDDREAACYSKGKLTFRDLETGRIRLQASAGPRSVASFSPDGRYLLSYYNRVPWSVEEGVDIWDLRSGELIEESSTLEGYYHVAVGLGAAPYAYNKYLVIRNGQGSYRGVELDRTLDAPAGLAFSPDGRYLASATGEKGTRLHDLSIAQEISRLESELPARHVCFTRDSKWLILACQDPKNRVLQVRRYLVRPTDLLREARSRTVRSLTREEAARYLPTP